MASLLEIDNNKTSFVCDAPIGMGGWRKVRFLDDGTETEKTEDCSSQIGCPTLNDSIPVRNESSKFVPEESVDSFERHPNLRGRSASKPHVAGLRELSGRSRALKKQYFDDTEPFTFRLDGFPALTPFTSIDGRNFKYVQYYHGADSYLGS